MPDFSRSIAIIVGINRYVNEIPVLRTAVNDARAIGALLSEQHGYESRLVLDEDATLARLDTLLTQDLPAQVGPDDRVFFYFAGHGVALDGDDGPQGYFVPQDARRESADSFLRMSALHDALCTLKCRHLLAVLDCCFAGAFRWSSTRALVPLPSVLYKERYQRFIRSAAWQAISSTAYDERALDVLAGKAIGVRDSDDQQHSPFAQVILDGLKGAADLVPKDGDGVITATELYAYMDDALAKLTEGRGVRQTPRLWPLRKDERGQYAFWVPGHEPNLPAAPELSDTANPYRGLQSFDEDHKDLFFGRARVVRSLEAHVEKNPLTVVLGATGSGKSSVVKAGLAPTLRDRHWRILPVVRPGLSPRKSLSVATADLGTVRDQDVLLVIDQLEELVTVCRDPEERSEFFRTVAAAMQSSPRLRVVVTLRSDFEQQFIDQFFGALPPVARFLVPMMTQDELREAIEKPAAERVMYFQPPELVDQLINEVVLTPGGLALLSFTLREMYVRYRARQGDDRALTAADYEALGGVVGALRQRATEEYMALDPAHRATMRRVMLRMVSAEEGDLARRRVPASELEYEDPAENERVEHVIARLTTTRLVVKDVDVDNRAFVEPAHDELVRGWDKLWEWIHAEYGRPDDLVFQRRLTQVAEEWAALKDRGARAALLYQDGARSDVLEQVRRSDDPWFNGIESEFARKSIKRRWTNRVALWATAAAILGLALLAALKWNSAVDNQKLALSRQLAAQALNELPYRLDRALLLAVEANRVSRTREARSSLFAAVQYSPQLVAFLSAHGHRVTAVDIAPDGKLAVSGDSHGTVTFWDRKTKRAADTLPVYGPVWSLAFNPDGNLLAVGSGSRTVTFWDVASRRFLGPPPSPVDSVRDVRLDYGNRIAFSPDGKELATANGDSTVVLWDVASRKPTRTLGFNGPVFCLAYNRDGVLAIGERGDVLLWNHALRSPTLGMRDSLITAISMAFSPDGKRLATGTIDNRIVFWDVNTRLFSSDSALHLPAEATTLAFSHGGDTLFAAGYLGYIARWEIRPHEPARPLPPLRGHAAVVGDLALTGDGRMVSGDWDGAVLAWDLRGLPSLGGVSLLRGDSRGLAFTREGRFLAVRNSDSTVAVFDRRDSLIRLFAISPDLKGAFAYTRDERALVFSSGDSVGVFDFGHPLPPRDLFTHDVPATRTIDFTEDQRTGAIAFSPDDSMVVAGTDSAWLWLMVAPHSFERIAPIAAKATDVAYSPKEDLIAVGNESAITFWDSKKRHAVAVRPLDNRQPVRDGDPDQPGVHLAFSPNGKMLAVGRGDSTLTFWDPVTFSPIGDRPVKLSSPIVTLRFDSGGSLLAAGLSDGGVALVDPVLKQALGAPLSTESGAARSLAFGPGDSVLAAGGSGAPLVFWDMKLESWIAQACRLANRDMIKPEWQQIVSGKGYESICPQYHEPGS